MSLERKVVYLFVGKFLDWLGDICQIEGTVDYGDCLNQKLGNF